MDYMVKLVEFWESKTNLTLQLSGLVGASAAMGRRGSMSKVGFQLVSYGVNQTIPRSGATNDACLRNNCEMGSEMFACCCWSVGNPQVWKQLRSYRPPVKKNQDNILFYVMGTSIEMAPSVLVSSYSVTINSNEVSTQSLLCRILVTC